MEKYEKAMRMAIHAAEKYVGATAPNPPVGAIGLDKNGKILLGAAHQKAGGPHAEAKLLEVAAQINKLRELETLVVTLEPCNHQGRTPPCTEAILGAKNIRRVVFGSLDPNPRVAGGGSKRLQEAGLEVIPGVLQSETSFLIRAFTKQIQTGRPYVTLKAAFTAEGSMVPPSGQKTFTSKPSLILSHELRKASDAIWTGSGTVLADNPEFTVRWVPDHPGKTRWLVLSDRRRRISKEWLAQAEKNSFLPHCAESFSEGLDFLGKNGAQRVLVEAGPILRQAWLNSGLWDESVVITQGKGDEDDKVEILFRE